LQFVRGSRGLFFFDVFFEIASQLGFEISAAVAFLVLATDKIPAHRPIKQVI
jgi:hypothetical protein